jgi:NTP pyrophosphatase (non-canonical NTP hydrolase)
METAIMLAKFQLWVKGRWMKNPRPEDLAIMTLGLCGEAGEVSEPIKKQIRGSKPVDREALKLELGDVLHYACAIANHFGIDMEEVLYLNIKKLEAREAAGDVQGRK